MTGTTIKGQIQREDLALFDGKTLVAQRPNSSGGTQTGNRMGDAVDVKLIHGGTANAASFQAALDSMGTANGALLFTPETWTIAANVTVPANVTLIVPAGCVFSINSGITVTNNGILIRYHKTYTSGSGTFTQNGIDSLQTADQTDIFGTDTGSTNTYAITTVTALSALATGVTVRFEASSTNTGSCTLNVDSTGAKTLKPAGTAVTMPVGSIQSGGIYTCVFDAGSDIWQVVNMNALVGQEINLNKDSAEIKMGSDSDVILRHSHNQGLIIKNANTTDDNPGTLYLQTGETDIALNDYLGRIFFQAPDEATGTDAITVAAEVSAISEGDFSSSNNATSLSFGTGASGAASQKMKLSSTGVLTLNGASGAIEIPVDSTSIKFGADADCVLLHLPDQGLAIKNANTSDDKPGTLYLQTGETDIEVNDYLGRIFFQAPDESTGTDAQTIAAEISAISEGDFAADNNATSLSFGTGASGAAGQKMKLSSTGVLTLNGSAGSIVIPDGGTIGTASDADALTLSSAGDCTHEGHVYAAADSTHDLGATATRWRQAFIDEIEVGANPSLTASAGNAAFFGYAGGGTEYAIEVKTDASTGVALYFLHSTTTVCGSISVGSSATAYNTSSDYRLKENVSDMSGAITRLKNLKPKRFNWISDENNELLDGFLAHEVDEVVPQAIHGEKDATKDGEPLYQGIDQSKLVPLLTGALQEAIAKIEALETRVAALEG